MGSPEFWRVILLGVVQGATEFLPISSKGHLVVFDRLLHEHFGMPSTPSSELQTVVALHVGTLVSIVVVFWRELWGLPSRPRLCAWILLASLPAGIAGLLLRKVLAQFFDNPLIVAVGWVITAAFLWFSERHHQDRWTLDTMRPQDALVVGFFQAIALIPGVSRSGSTIAGGLVTGLSRQAAASFSFLIAIPVIAGAALVEVGPLVVDMLRGSAPHTGTPDIFHLVAGALTACIVGILCLKWLIRLLVRRQLHWFAVYCLAAAALVTAWQIYPR